MFVTNTLVQRMTVRMDVVWSGFDIFQVRTGSYSVGDVLYSKEEYGILSNLPRTSLPIRFDSIRFDSIGVQNPHSLMGSM
mmetsp:Transcript_39918/g.120194  ORF Transcript_39918/g.120194 Transcript_39918/m.120194 type:complete len:80 (+) Transcript_39918:1478-1717(+)